jgi:hypothetical protein
MSYASYANPSMGSISPKVNTAIDQRFKSGEEQFVFEGSNSNFNRSTALASEEKVKFKSKQLLNHPSVLD